MFRCILCTLGLIILQVGGSQKIKFANITRLVFKNTKEEETSDSLAMNLSSMSAPNCVGGYVFYLLLKVKNFQPITGLVTSFTLVHSFLLGILYDVEWTISNLLPLLPPVRDILAAKSHKLSLKRSRWEIFTKLDNNYVMFSVMVQS